MKRLCVWVWMTAQLVSYYVLTVQLGKIMSRWAAEDGYENCFSHALHQFFQHGGFVIASPSPQNGWHFHYHWSPDLQTFESYNPKPGTVGRWKLAHDSVGIMPLTFVGELERWHASAIPQKFQRPIRAIPVEDYLELGV